MRVLSSLLLLLACWFAAAPCRGAEFDAANQRYDEGKFAEAKAGYERLVGAGQWSANLFYNLGNANHRLGLPGEAVLAYERALTLDPGHPEGRANLEFVRGRTGAVRWPISLLDQMLPAKRADFLAVIGAIAGWVAIFALAIHCQRRRPASPALWFGVVMALLIAGYSAAVIWRSHQDRALAVVTAKTAELRLAPAESAGLAAALPAGSEVRELSERGDWIYCAAPNGARGWISARSVARIRLPHS